MTPRELARLQDFPDDFIFVGSKSNILKQIGNAVPVGLGRAISENVFKMLSIHYPIQTKTKKKKKRMFLVKRTK